MKKWEDYSFGKNLRMGSSSPRTLRTVNIARNGSRYANYAPKLMVIAAWPRKKAGTDQRMYHAHLSPFL